MISSIRLPYLVMWLMVAALPGTLACSTQSNAPTDTGRVEPPGMTFITEQAFNSTSQSGWLLGADYAVNLSIISDGTAPRSPSSIAQIRYPAGFEAGSSPASVSYDFSDANARTMYSSMWVKLSPNWVGQISTANKVVHIFINGLNRLYAFAAGSDNGPLTPSIGLQQLAQSFNAVAQGGAGIGVSTLLRPNVAGQTGVQIVRGRWHKWEMVLYAGTAGRADGTADWWIDGVKVGHYTGIPFVAAGGSNRWEIFNWDPTWGGNGGAIPAEQYVWMDHVYVSGKP